MQKEVITHNGVNYRISKKLGYYMGCHKGHVKLLHRVLYEEYHGVKIPDGYHIHHLNGIKTDNRKENLVMMSSHDHGIETYNSMTEEWHNKRMIDFQNGRESAKAWHRSEDGIEWHRKHYDCSLKKSHERIERICKFCGKKFIGEKKSMYCSQSCKEKSVYRNDNHKVESVCVVCGKKFTYQKDYKHATQTCSRECSVILRGRTIDNSRVDVPCIVCGKKFRATSFKKVHVCSKTCYTRLYRNRLKSAT